MKAYKFGFEIFKNEMPLINWPKGFSLGGLFFFTLESSIL